MTNTIIHFYRLLSNFYFFTSVPSIHMYINRYLQTKASPAQCLIKKGDFVCTLPCFVS
jgi:hypothetical protein